MLNILNENMSLLAQVLMYHYKKTHESDSFERIASLFNADRRHVSKVFAKLEEFRQNTLSEQQGQEVANQEVSNQEVTNQEVTCQEIKLETEIDLG